MEVKKLFSRKTKESKPNCVLCGKTTSENPTPLMYTYIDEDGIEENAEFGKLCDRCANALDENEKRAPVEVDDEDEEKDDEWWEEVDKFFDFDSKG